MCALTLRMSMDSSPTLAAYSGGMARSARMARWSAQRGGAASFVHVVIGKPWKMVREKPLGVLRLAGSSTAGAVQSAGGIYIWIFIFEGTLARALVSVNNNGVCLSVKRFAALKAFFARTGDGRNLPPTPVRSPLQLLQRCRALIHCLGDAGDDSNSNGRISILNVEVDARMVSVLAGRVGNISSISPSPATHPPNSPMRRPELAARL